MAAQAGQEAAGRGGPLDTLPRTHAGLPPPPPPRTRPGRTRGRRERSGLPGHGPSAPPARAGPDQPPDPAGARAEPRRSEGVPTDFRSRRIHEDMVAGPQRQLPPAQLLRQLLPVSARLLRVGGRHRHHVPELAGAGGLPCGHSGPSGPRVRPRTEASRGRAAPARPGPRRRLPARPGPPHLGGPRTAPAAAPWPPAAPRSARPPPAWPRRPPGPGPGPSAAAAAAPDPEEPRGERDPGRGEGRCSVSGSAPRRRRGGAGPCGGGLSRRGEPVGEGLVRAAPAIRSVLTALFLIYNIGGHGAPGSDGGGSGFGSEGGHRPPPAALAPRSPLAPLRLRAVGLGVPGARGGSRGKKFLLSYADR